MKIATKLLSLLLLVLLTVPKADAQDRPDEGTVGLTASIQSGQTNLQAPIWVSESISVAPILGINHRADSFTDLNIGVAPRFYQDMGNNFASYIGAQGLVQYTSPEVGPEDTDLLLGATGGGEYFFNGHFSLGVEGQLNFFLNDNGNDAFSTGAAIMGTYYF